MRILVVEDSKEISDFLKTSLEAECFAVDVAEDGEKGAQLGRINDYDLIILDNMLPKKLGKDVCVEIRSKKKDVPIIMLSVKADVPTKVDLLNIGADDYLAKPFSFDELLARIRGLLRRPRQSAEDIIKLDDLVVDVKKHTVTRGKREISLTRKEFMLLEFLLRKKGEVISRITLMEHVWDMNVDPFSNTVDTHMGSLRRKIELPGEKSLIKTVSGRGYKADFE